MAEHPAHDAADTATLASGHRYELVSAATLVSHPRNPRRGNVDAIRASIRHHGFHSPLVVQASTRHVLVGNHRLEAAVGEGLDEVPVVWVDVDDDQARRMLVADNRTSDLATWDEHVLAELLQSFEADGALDGLSYDGDDLDDLLARIAEPSFEPVSEDEQPRLDRKKPITCPECGHSWEA